MAHVQKKILVIDDEAVVREIFVLALKDYAVILAEDGISAVRKYQEQPDISLVLMDVHMPGLSGASLLVALRRQNPSLKIVVVSGYGPQIGQDEAFLRAHVQAWVEKPFDIAVIKNICAQLLES